MEIAQLRYFAAAARLGNISKAAQELYVTQPNLSKSIARLEEDLGVPLFEHRKGKILLNDYGRCFLVSVDRVLAELDDGVLSVQRMYESAQNILSLGCSIDDFLPDVLREFALVHPEIGIRQFCCGIPELADRLGRRTLDLALTAHSHGGDAYTFQELGRSEFVVLAGRTHPLAGRKYVSIKALADENLICDRSRLDAPTLSAICRQHGFTPNIVFEAENTSLIYSLLASNRGVAFMPIVQMRKINNEYPNSGIHMIFLEDPVEPARIGVLYRRDYVWSQAAKTFMEFLKAWLAKESDEVAQLKHIALEA